MTNPGLHTHPPPMKRYCAPLVHYGCFLTDVNYGDVDYGSNDPVTITMSVRYDNALQTTTPGGVGNPVTRTNNGVATS